MAERATKKDLTLTPTIDLINEIASRHDALVITGIRFETQEKYVLNRHFHGHRYICLGLLSSMENRINEKENEILDQN